MQNKLPTLTLLLSLITPLTQAHAINTPPEPKAISQAQRYQEYTAFKRTLIQTRLKAEKLTRKIRKLGKVESWTSVQLREDLRTAQSILDALNQYRKSFIEYDIEGIRQDEKQIREYSIALGLEHAAIDQRLAIHSEIEDVIARAKKEASKAFNKTKQLLFVRKQIEKEYRDHVDDALRFQGTLSVIRSRIETQETLLEINGLEHQLNQLEKAEKRAYGSVLGPLGETYEPSELLKEVERIEARFLQIFNRSSRELKVDSIALKAVRRI